MSNLCYFHFFTKECKLGSACKSRHSVAQSHLESEDDLDFVILSCHKNPRHCKSYLLGICDDGEDCSLNHDLIDSINQANRMNFRNKATPKNNNNNNNNRKKNNSNNNKRRGNSRQLVVQPQQQQQQLVAQPQSDVAIQTQLAMQQLQYQLELEKIKYTMQLENTQKFGEMEVKMLNMKLETNKAFSDVEKEAIKATAAVRDELKDAQSKLKDEAHANALRQETLLGEEKEKRAKLEGKIEAIGTTPVGFGWWNAGWGPNCWGGQPRYCVHGSSWSHCYTGPPKYCRHGSNWGSCCYQPY